MDHSEFEVAVGLLTPEARQSLSQLADIGLNAKNSLVHDDAVSKRLKNVPGDALEWSNLVLFAPYLMGLIDSVPITASPSELRISPLGDAYAWLKLAVDLEPQLAAARSKIVTAESEEVPPEKG